MLAQRPQSSRASFRFVPPAGDNTYSAQLQEWSNFSRIAVSWGFSDSREGGNVIANSATPVINGHAYTEYQGVALTRKEAKNQAAGKLILSGLLSVQF